MLPARHRSELPREPWHVDDVPPGEMLFRGTLVCYHATHSGRPYLGVRVACDCWARFHTYAWRFYYGLDVDACIPVRSRCQSGWRYACWIGLDGDRSRENLAVFKQYHRLYRAWQSAEKRRRAAAWQSRNATSAAWRRRDAGGDLVPLWRDPVGSLSLTA